jgi:hypothetical protein
MPDGREPLVRHEAGHAVACVALGFGLYAIKFEEVGNSLRVYEDEWRGDTCAEVPQEDAGRDWCRAAIVAMAGRAARRQTWDDEAGVSFLPAGTGRACVAVTRKGTPPFS